MLFFRKKHLKSSQSQQEPAEEVERWSIKHLNALEFEP